MIRMKRIGVVDSLRAAAILLVIIRHAMGEMGIVPGGNVAPETSFFVSGFGIMLPYAQWRMGRRKLQDWRSYVSKRFWKIVPSYYLAILVVAFVFPFHVKAGIDHLQDVALHLSFLHGFNSISYFSLNGNFWSLAIEVQFYLLFPVILFAFVRSAWIALVAIAALAGLFPVYVFHANLLGQLSWAYSAITYVPMFMFGIATAFVYERTISEVDIPKRWRVVATVISLASLAGIVAYWHSAWTPRYGGDPWVWDMENRCALAALLVTFTLSTSAAATHWQAFTTNPFLRFISDISYNMFLWNAPIIALLWMFWRGGPSWAFVVLSVCAIIVAGFIMTHALERPLMNLGHRLLARYRKKAAPVQETFSPAATY